MRVLARIKKSGILAVNGHFFTGKVVPARNRKVAVPQPPLPAGQIDTGPK